MSRRSPAPMRSPTTAARTSARAAAPMAIRKRSWKRSGRVASMARGTAVAMASTGASAAPKTGTATRSRSPSSVVAPGTVRQRVAGGSSGAGMVARRPASGRSRGSGRRAPGPSSCSIEAGSGEGGGEVLGVERAVTTATPRSPTRSSARIGAAAMAKGGVPTMATARSPRRLELAALREDVVTEQSARDRTRQASTPASRLSTPSTASGPGNSSWRTRARNASRAWARLARAASASAGATPGSVAVRICSRRLGRQPERER